MIRVFVAFCIFFSLDCVELIHRRSLALDSKPNHPYRNYSPLNTPPTTQTPPPRAFGAAGIQNQPDALHDAFVREEITNQVKLQCVFSHENVHQMVHLRIRRAEDVPFSPRALHTVSARRIK